jgi:hypothetical protein
MSKTFTADRSLWAGASGISNFLAAAQRQQPIRVTGLTKSQAEDLLDWLEANAYSDYHLSYSAGRGFSVSFSTSREPSS